MALSNVFFRLALVIVSAVASGVVRRTAVGSGAWSQADAKSKSGVSFWRALRKELEAKKKAVVASERQATSHRETLAKALKRIKSDDIHRQSCQIDAGNTYASFADIIYVQFNVASAQECSVLCSIDGMGGQGNGKLCKSFTYNKLTRECNFQGSPTPALHKHSCCDSGMPCTLDGIRQDIQEAYQTEFAQALQAEKDLGEKLAKTNQLLLEEQTKEHAVSVELEKLSGQKAVELKKHQDVPKAPAFLPKPNAHTEKKSVPVQAKPVELRKTQAPPDQAKKTVAVVAKGIVASASKKVITKKKAEPMVFKQEKTERKARQWPYAPMPPVYPAPMQPAYAAPMQPVYAPPMQPAYTAPVQPAYAPPMQPAYAAPMQPAYTPPMQPAYPAPAQAVPMPAAAMPMPAARPAAPAAPVAPAHKKAAPKKEESSSGAGWLLHMFFVMAIVFVIAGVVSGGVLKRREAQRDVGRYSVHSR